MSSTIPFRKYHGLGNDFILVDNRHSPEPVLSSSTARQWCDRHFGVGGDGVIFLLPPSSPEGHFGMRLFNSDGSEPEMCGNGIRCLAQFAADIGAVESGQTKLNVDTLGGLMVPEIKGEGMVKVDMNQPLTEPAERIPVDFGSGKNTGQVGPVDGKVYDVTAVSMGNPHAVIFVDDEAEFMAVDTALESVGSAVEMWEREPGTRSFPAGMNVEFVLAEEGGAKARVSVWERGSGRTMACGTGACAVVVAGVLEGKLQRTCEVQLPGGSLHITWDEATNKVLMTGPAQLVFCGER